MAIAAAPPAVITAGDTVSFAYTAAGYAASAGYGMVWRLVGPGVALNLSAVALGDGFTVTAPASATAALAVPAAGVPCTLIGSMQLGAERATVYRAPCQLMPDPATVTGDIRSQPAIILDAITALLAGRATMDQQSYKIGDRELSRIPIPELMALREYFRAEVRRTEQAEAAAQGRIGRRSRLVHARMVRS